MKHLLVILLLALAAPGRAAIDGAAGTAGDAFAGVGGSARALAMGGAGAADLREPGAIWVNPAQLAGLEGAGAGVFLHGLYVQDVAVDQLAIAVPTALGTFGGAYGSMRMGEIEALDRLGSPAALPLSPQDWTAGGAWAGRVGAFAAGASAWYLRSELAPGADAVAYAGDFGGSWTPIPAFAAGLAVQHLGSGLDYGGKAAALPLTIRLGAGFRPARTGLTLVADAVKAGGTAIALHAGAEERLTLAPGWWADLRGGWRTGAPSGGSATGVSAGAGVDWRPADTGARLASASDEPYERFGVSGVRVDYAWTPLGELGQVHWLSFSLAF